MLDGRIYIEKKTLMPFETQGLISYIPLRYIWIGMLHIKFGENLTLGPTSYFPLFASIIPALFCMTSK